MLLFTQCADPDVSPVPKIELEETVFVGDTTYPPKTLQVRLSYIDGDGDIGLDLADTTSPFHYGSPYFYNIHVEYYELVNDTFRQVVPVFPPGADTIGFSGRLPRLTPGEGEPIEGEIVHEIVLEQVPVKDDHFRLRIWIYDRELNRSNVVETETLVL